MQTGPCSAAQSKTHLDSAIAECIWTYLAISSMSTK
jgi:hypothetical protein